MSEVIITNENFEAEVLQSDIPVLVDFSATWCGPCRRMDPLVSKLAEEYEGKVKVCKVDVDECTDVARKYGIMSVPTFMMFKDGVEVSKTAGSMPAVKLAELMDEGAK